MASHVRADERWAVGIVIALFCCPECVRLRISGKTRAEDDEMESLWRRATQAEPLADSEISASGAQAHDR